MKEKGRVKKDRFKGIDNKLSLRVFLLQDQDEQKELGRLEAVERKEAAQDRDGPYLHVLEGWFMIHLMYRMSGTIQPSKTCQ